MRLIWSALWEASPREMHLISEFLIPSLRTSALAPFAAPWEVSGVEGGSRAQANKAQLGGLSHPLSPLPQTQLPSRTTRGQVPGTQVRALVAAGRQRHPCFFSLGRKALGQDGETGK